MASILTYSQIVTTFKDIQVRHYQLKGFFHGEDEDVGADKELQYPALIIRPKSSSLIKSENGYNTLEITVTLKVADLINPDLSNETDVLSDCLQIISDIVKEFDQRLYYMNSNINIVGDVNFDVLKEYSDENISGWGTDLKLRIISQTNVCGLPFSGFTSTSFPNV